MTGARLENELIRWDANEREESGGAWQRTLDGESPGCRVMFDIILWVCDTAGQLTDNQC